MRLYLEDAYLRFEQEFLMNRKLNTQNKEEPTIE